MASDVSNLVYNYAFSSMVDGRAIRLAASTEIAPVVTPGVYFDGRLRHPREAAVMLLALSRIVRTHFFDARPPMMDPIVTTSRTLLRWEGFSGCCGAYARIDLDEDALETDARQFGTTNVDFNAEMLALLSGVGSQDDVGLSVSTDAVEVRSNAKSVVEKRVELPKRWLKGLCEVQVYQSRLTLRHRFTPAMLTPLLQTVGRDPKKTQYLTLTGPRPRLTLRPTSGAIAVGGVSRLSALRPLLPIAREVSLYSDDESGVHGWVADLPWARFWLILSPELYRGFSGEGQALVALAQGGWEQQVDAACNVLSAKMGGEPAETIDPAEMAARLGIKADDARSVLHALATSGLAGFDAHTGYYFQRRLPMDLDRVKKSQPRLEGAEKLVDRGDIRIVERISESEADVEVDSGDMTYFVRLRASGDRCTCPWFSKHQGERGPCKHVLAARLVVERTNKE